MGKWLNIGSSITAFLDSYECVVNGSQASSSQITCTTSASRNPQEIRVLTLIIDGANRTYSCGNDMMLSNDFGDNTDKTRRLNEYVLNG